MQKKLILLTAGLLATSAASAEVAGPRALVLEGGTLIDGTGRAPIPNSAIVVEGGRIKAVGVKGRLTYPAGARIINVSGRTVLPGLIDSHTHTQDWDMPLYLPWGVTTIAMNSGDTPWVLAQREAVKAGKIKGPRVFISGTIIHGVNGYRQPVGSFNTPAVETVEEARAAASKLIDQGVDFIKVNANISDEQLKAVIALAKERHVPLLGHTRNFRLAAGWGFKHAEHMWTVAAGLNDPEGKQPVRQNLGSSEAPPETRMDPQNYASLIALMVREGVFLNPPLMGDWSGSSAHAQEYADMGAKMAADPKYAFVPERVRKNWGEIPDRRAGYDKVAAFIRQYAAAGGKISIGPDSSAGGDRISGISIHQEMQLFSELGYTPMQVIEAATLWNAQLIGKDKELGSVEPGKLGDFVVIEGNPLQNIANTRNIRMVIKEGEVMDTGIDANFVNPMPQPYSMYQFYPNELPRITGFAPRMASQDGPPVTVTIEGDKFTPASVVHFDENVLPTKFISPTRLEAIMDAKALAHKPGSYVLYVINTGAHGTISQPAYFLVNLKQ